MSQASSSRRAGDILAQNSRSKAPSSSCRRMTRAMAPERRPWGFTPSSYRRGSTFSGSRQIAPSRSATLPCRRPRPSMPTNPPGRRAAMSAPAPQPRSGGAAHLADPSGGPSRSRGDQDHAAADAIKRTDRELESHRPPRLSSWLGSTASSCRSASGLGLIPTRCAPWSTGFGRTAGRVERSGGPPRNPGSKKGVLYKRTPIL